MGWFLAMSSLYDDHSEIETVADSAQCFSDELKLLYKTNIIGLVTPKDILDYCSISTVKGTLERNVLHFLLLRTRLNVINSMIICSFLVVKVY